MKLSISHDWLNWAFKGFSAHATISKHFSPWYKSSTSLLVGATTYASIKDFAIFLKSYVKFYQRRNCWFIPLTATHASCLFCWCSNDFFIFVFFTFLHVRYQQVNNWKALNCYNSYLLHTSDCRRVRYVEEIIICYKLPKNNNLTTNVYGNHQIN